ncbi:MAG TPA: DUF4199 domain-containing protein [Chryseosolibacter sp.]
MKKIVFIYGLIAGLISVAMFFISHPTGEINFENGMLIGYATMVIAFSLIFFGVKNYRDNHLEGTITFGKAFQVGILVTLVASVVYALGWEVYYNFIGNDFMAQYSKYYLDEMVKEGASAAEIEQARTQMQSTAEMYKNPVIRFAMTLMEIFPVGLIVTLICAALLRKPQFLPKEA